MAHWRLIAHHANSEDAADLYRNEGFIAIGWGQIGDLDQLAPANNTTISKLIRAQYPENADIGAGGRSLLSFWSEMAVGDLVIVGPRGGRQFVMEVTGPYEHCPGADHPIITDYFHRRSAQVVPVEANAIWTGLAKGWSFRWPLVRLQ